MKKVLKIVSVILIILILIGTMGVLLYKNAKLKSSYETAVQQVNQLQSKLDAIGTFTDVYTVKTEVKMGQEITKEDLVLQTVPTSSVPSNIITDTANLIGNYFRIGLQPGVPLTTDFINVEEYIGSVYDKDVFLDSLPVGTKVGDYIDIRVVLPGGEEFVVFNHKRVNARYENAVKMRFDEADLWIYTSMMVDRALYKDYGLKIYATKYVDPGSHDKTVAYYPVRKEVTDIMGISPNLTDEQKARMWNEDLRKSIETKLAYYSDPLNEDASEIAAAVKEEETRYSQATTYYESLLEDLEQGGNTNVQNDTGLVDPSQSKTEEVVGNLDSSKTSNTSNENSSSKAPTADGQTDAKGNGNVVKQQDILDSQGDNLFEDETPIQ